MQDMPQVGLAGPRRTDAGGISDLFLISSTGTPYSISMRSTPG
jgi:hypothetical protein